MPLQALNTLNTPTNKQIQKHTHTHFMQYNIIQIIILSSKTTVLLRSSVLPFFRSVPLFRNCCTLLALPISPEIMDRF